MFSAIFASMNREKALEVSLPSWTKINKIKDFVIVDWSSSKPLIENKIIQEQINKYGNIKIIRVENQKYFYRCLAWNLAFQNTDPENKILIKLDTEYYNRDSSWIEKLVLDEDDTLKNYFYGGTCGGNLHSYGFLMVNKKHFGEGYNENLEAIWGFEDADIYDRIKNKNKISVNSFGPHYIIHLPHSDQSRFSNVKEKVMHLRFKKDNIEPILNKKINVKAVGKDGKGVPTRNNCTNFHIWEPARYRILEDSLTYKRVELIEP
jgi:hypothetical protein